MQGQSPEALAVRLLVHQLSGPLATQTSRIGDVDDSASEETENMGENHSARWSQLVKLTAIDTSNIWRTSKGALINPWMDAARMTGWFLWLRFVTEEGQPEVLFTPIANQGQVQWGMRPAHHENRSLWTDLVAGASRSDPLTFSVCYSYSPMD